MTNPAAGSPDLSLAVAGIRLQNPVMVASGTFGYGPEFAELIDLNRLGAIVVKGISIEPEKGNPTPRMLEVPGGLLNAIGLQNPGFEKFVAEYMPFLRGLRIPLIVNIWGRTIEQYGNLAARFDAVQPDALVGYPRRKRRRVRPVAIAALDRFVGDEPRVAAAPQALAGGRPAPDVRLILIRHAHGASIETRRPAGREV